MLICQKFVKNFNFRKISSGLKNFQNNYQNIKNLKIKIIKFNNNNNKYNNKFRFIKNHNLFKFKKIITKFNQKKKISNRVL